MRLDFAEITRPIILALVLAWTVGIWLGGRLARHARGEAQPRLSVGGLMMLVLVVALGLALAPRDPSVFFYAIVLVPAVALQEYLSRPR